MKYSIVLAETAIVQLEAHTKFYEEKRSGLGLEFEDEIFETITYIQSNPNLFPLKFETFHEAVVSRFPFVIVYEVIGKTVLVASVFNTNQNPIKKKKTKTS